MNKFISSAMLALLLVSCGTTKIATDVKNVAVGAYDCAKVDLSKIVTGNGATLLADAAQIILGGGTTWETDLAALGLKFGSDSEACAVNAVLGAIGMHPATTDGQTGAAARARAIIAKQGWTYK